MTDTVQDDAYFEPLSYRRSIAGMFAVLDATAQRELIDKLCLLPRHIHDLATKGLIADAAPSAQTSRKLSRNHS